MIQIALFEFNMIKTICYISDSKTQKNLNKLDHIYLKTKSNNLKDNITGIFIHIDKNYLQVLEGEPEKVDKIKTDKRHYNVIEVINTTTKDRVFEDYNFGFSVLKKSGIAQFEKLHRMAKACRS